MGFAIMVSMLLSVELEKGAYFDLRNSLLAISAVFGGPLAIAVTAPMAMIFRAMMGGAGAVNGLIGIGIISTVCLTIHLFLGKNATGTRGIVATAFALPATSIALMLGLMPPNALPIMYQMGMLMALLNLIAATVAGTVIMHFQKFTLERDILRASLTQAPDFHYVKDLESRIVVTNLNVARYNGRQKSSDMVGLTDFDLTSSERAQILFEAEQKIMQTDEPLIDFEEVLFDENHNEKHFSTTKVVLKNRHGETVGLAGVTRDVTQRKQLERALLESRNLMSQAMAEMSDGLAMFDNRGYLLFCNDNYRSAFPLSAYARQPGAHITDILRAAVRNGERKDIPTNVSEAAIQDAASGLFLERDTEVALSDGRWLSLRTRSMQGGSALVVVSDISATKQAELSLRQLADQMKGLAETDELTGIANRRAFDAAISAECHKAAIDGAPVSLLVIDVDRFKAYNDAYGHPAGDSCLKQVGECLRALAKRPSDVVARYGGEEFVALFPGTDLKAASGLAEKFRSALEQRNIPHSGSEHGIVTASIGVSSMTGYNVQLSPAELVSRADEAVYRAKNAGRNRVEASSSAQNRRDQFSEKSA